MNYPIFTHPGQPEMQVEVILASRGIGVPPIYTIRMRYPRIIHAEPSTHRIMSQTPHMVEVYTPTFDIMSDKDLSRNARSSRAVPVKTMLEEIRTRPFVPWHWGKNQRGMQAGEEHNAIVRLPTVAESLHDAEHLTFTPCVYGRGAAWLWARDRAVEAAEAFDAAGYHKQLVNRLIEPFSWIDTLITTTNIENFLWLRDHEAAEPHLRDLARLVRQAVEDVKAFDRFQELRKGEWHLPYITWTDRDYASHLPMGIEEQNKFLCQLSAARCARISYRPFDGDASYERELERYQSLVASDRVHASPMEHQASPDTWFPAFQRYLNPELHGNLKGWIQFRKQIPGEAHKEEMAA